MTNRVREKKNIPTRNKKEVKKNLKNKRRKRWRESVRKREMESSDMIENIVQRIQKRGRIKTERQ